jgi:hypothetical protein
VTHAFLSDAAQKALVDLDRGEHAAVEQVRRHIEEDPVGQPVIPWLTAGP